MKKLFLLLMTVFAISLCASAQTRTVRGIVLDVDNDEPLPGVSVSAGANGGAVTDIDGVFAIKVPANVGKLTFSMVGFKTVEANIPSAGEMLVKMHLSATNLDEVIAVAYGSAKKSAFTGSAAVVKADAIENTQVTNVLNALDGRVAGVQMTNASGQPGQTTPTIRIRGISSINAGNSPLIVVDGTPYSGDINNINTADIESMTVLKDAASNALYGARGANGVILITTKQGRDTGSAVVTLDAKWGQNSRASRLYDMVKDPAQYYEVFYDALNNYALSNGMNADRAYMWANSHLFDNTYGTGYNVYTIPAGQTLIGRDGKLNPQATLGRVVGDYMLMPDNWMENAYKKSLRQEYNVSVSNGNERGNFYASFGYLNNEGITNNSGYERMTGRLSASSQVKSWLKVGGTANYTHYRAKQLDEDGSSASSGNIFAAGSQVAPIYPLFIRDAEGNIIIDDNGNTVYDYGDGANAGLRRPSFARSNALSDAILNTNKYEGYAFSTTGFFEVRFLKDFKFTSNNNINLDETRSTTVTNPYYGSYADSKGIVSKAHGRTRTYTLQQLLNWDHSFGDHNVSLLAGHENYVSTSYALSGSRSNMFDPNNDELAGAVVGGDQSSSKTKYNNEGWIFRGQYDYADKYFGSASFRRDGSSRFHPSHRWGNFFSVGAAWIISKESWFDAPWVDQLKLKASYGEQGNDNIGNFRYVNTYVIENVDGDVAIRPNSMGNPDITWEKNGNFNAGFEFSLWNARLSGSFEGFYRKTSDMLSWVPLPDSFGWTGYYANIGDMTNRGIELELHGDILRGKDYDLGVDFNLTWYKNKISKLDPRRKTVTHDGHGGYENGSYFYGEGLPLYTFLMPSYAGVDPETGVALYWMDSEDEDGNPIRETTTEYGYATQYCQGTALPDVYGGFNIHGSYKGFDLSVDFAYSIGGQCYDSDYAKMMSSPTSTSRGYNFHADLFNAWTPENTNTDVPRNIYTNGNDDYAYQTSTSNRFLTDASYLSLQNINFGYTLPKTVTDKMYLKSLRVYLSADNVWLWSKRQGLDPRQSLAGSSTASYYAPIRTISGGINITF